MFQVQELTGAVYSAVSEARFLLQSHRCGGDDWGPEFVVARARDLDWHLRRAAAFMQSEDVRRVFMAVYDEPPATVGGVSAPSYHELGFELARKVLLGVFCAADILYYGEHKPQGAEALSRMDHTLDPGILAQRWSNVKTYVENEAPTFDAGELMKMIRDESVRAERFHGGGIVASTSESVGPSGDGVLDSAQDAIPAIPAPPSSLTELPRWIQAARELLRDQEDQPIEEAGIACLVRKHFLEHVERLCPQEWPAWHLAFNPQRFETVRELVVMMAWAAQRISEEPPAPIQVKGFDAKPPG